jgi:hypothetical protein
MKRGPRISPERQARAARMAQLYTTGHTLQQIGTVFGLTRERVRQILKTQGIVGKDGGVCRASQARKAEKAAKSLAKRDERCRKSFGCSLEELLAINHGENPWAKSAISRRYTNQRRSAEHRNIPWQITFPEWWAIWEPHYANRRRTADGFVMARHQDFGPYAPWNVYITTLAQNVVDYQAELKKRGVECADGYKRLPERAAQLKQAAA